MQQYWNFNQIIDGHTTIEHSIPCDLHNDSIELFAKSGTGYTPTLIVNYGGIMGENWFYNFDNVWEEQMLMTWSPQMNVMARSMRRVNAYSPSDYHQFATSRQVNQVLKQGGIVELGAHGQIQGLGFHWELKMFTQGGMANMDVLMAATYLGAKAMGVESVIGSIEVGKLADILLLEPGANPLTNIDDAKQLDMVIKDGVIYYPTRNMSTPFSPAPKMTVLNVPYRSKSQ